MSNLIDKIKSRRNIRKYTNQPVATELIHTIIETATFAPSAHNAQPWRFIVVTKPEQKSALSKTMAQVWLKQLELDQIPEKIRLATANRSVKRFTEAPALILACSTMENMGKYSDIERQQNERDLAIHSVGAAIHTLLLAAHAQGLGACWYCTPVFCKSQVRQLLEIPENVDPQALITLGYPAESPKKLKENQPKLSLMEKNGVNQSNIETQK